ncbi:MAG: hypothetical protein IT168_19825 [Bryobacterales bacterium]|nr:hypothetical protein [Bryobacterales bacterium]
MTTEQQLREKLRKITALYEGAATPGERQAAAAAIERLRQVLSTIPNANPNANFYNFFTNRRPAEKAEEPIEEFKFSMADQWQRRLFNALCRRHGIHPFRYKRQRHNTVVIRARASFVNQKLWPEYLDLEAALQDYLNEATERIIREEVFNDASEPDPFNSRRR